jgi:hypothetical protein
MTSVMDTKQRRNVITDTHASTALSQIKEPGELNWEERRNSTEIELSDFETLYRYFDMLGSMLHRSNQQIGFNFNGNEYTFISRQCRVTEKMRGGHIHAELTMKRNSDPAQKWIVLTYSLFMRHDGKRILSFIGNPTTIVSGSNIRPIAVKNATAFKESLSFFQMGFQLLKSIFADNEFEWSKETAKRLQRGEIRVNNAQWAVYLGSKDKQLDMALLSGLYCGRLVTKGYSRSLSEHLGFEAKGMMKGAKDKITGLFLMKQKGRNHVLSVNFYDKKQSVANKKQTKSLSELELNLIDNTLRLDITAHPRFLDSILRAAKKRSGELIEDRPELATNMKRFLETPLTGGCTAYMLCKAMHILSLYKDKTGKWTKGSFTKWLIDRVLNDELHLMSILKQEPRLLANFKTDNAQIQRAIQIWQVHKSDLHILEVLEQKLRVSASACYRLLNKIREQHGIDITVPYRYWIDLDLLSAVYGLSTKERIEYHNTMFSHSLGAVERDRALEKLHLKSKKSLQHSKESLRSNLDLNPIWIDADTYTPVLI